MSHALVHAPRSLRALSSEHRHGWGVAKHSRSRWSLALGTTAAHEDPGFDRACEGETHAWIAHVRLATVGSVLRENTHPFLRGRWCFAHNGTIRDIDFLSRSTSRMRHDEREGSTDSELFFAYLLSRLDDEGLTDAPACARTDRVITEAVRAAIDREAFGAINFAGRQHEEAIDFAGLVVGRFGHEHEEAELRRRSTIEGDGVAALRVGA